MKDIRRNAVRVMDTAVKKIFFVLGIVVFLFASLNIVSASPPWKSVCYTALHEYATDNPEHILELIDADELCSECLQNTEACEDIVQDVNSDLGRIYNEGANALEGKQRQIQNYGVDPLVKACNTDEECGDPGFYCNASGDRVAGTGLFSDEPDTPPDVSPGIGVNVRAKSGAMVRGYPSTSDTSGYGVGGKSGVIMGGPANSQGGVQYTWWNVNFVSGADGWIRDNDLDFISEGLGNPISTKFTNEQKVLVKNNAGVDVMLASGRNKTGTQANQSLGKIIGGPEFYALDYVGYIWWNVNFDSGVDGWVKESFLVDGTGFVSGDGSQPSVSSSKFSINDSIKVFVESENARLKVREIPKLSSPDLGGQPDEAKGKVVGGPMYDQGTWFWQVDFASGVDGWVPEEEIEEDSTSCVSEDIFFVNANSVCCEGQTAISSRLPSSTNLGACTALCGNGFCNTHLESEYNCPSDCVPKAGVCKELPEVEIGCQRDAQCQIENGEGFACVNGVCLEVIECGSDLNCRDEFGERFICIEHKCVEDELNDGTCYDETDCKTGQICDYIEPFPVINPSGGGNINANVIEGPGFCKYITTCSDSMDRGINPSVYGITWENYSDPQRVSNSNHDQCILKTTYTGGVVRYPTVDSCEAGENCFVKEFFCNGTFRDTDNIACVNGCADGACIVDPACTAPPNDEICNNAGKECGTISNPCGTMITCGTCNSTSTCNADGRCIQNAATCVPQTKSQACGTKVCGTVSNGTCGTTITCGTCSSGNSCNTNGQCVVGNNAPVINTFVLDGSGIVDAYTIRTWTIKATDPQGQIIKARIDWGDSHASLSTIEVNKYSGETFTLQHEYPYYTTADWNNHNIVLTVTDAEGLTATRTMPISVYYNTGEPPSGAITVTSPTARNYTVGETMLITWNSPSTVQTVALYFNNGFNLIQAGVPNTGSYSLPLESVKTNEEIKIIGRDYATGTGVDLTGVSASFNVIQSTAPVNNSFQILSTSLSAPSSVFVGDSNIWTLKTNVPAAYSSGCKTGEGIMYTLNFGDGMINKYYDDCVGGILGYAPETTTKHTYNENKSFTITGTATSNITGWNGTATRTLGVKVLNKPVVINKFEVQARDTKGMISQMRVLASGGAPGVLTCKVNWGDGNTSTHSCSSGGTFNPTHTYTNIGNWNPTLTVTDSIGQSVSKQLYLASQIKKPAISNFNCPDTFTRAYATSYMTCTFRIDSIDGSNIWYSIDWNGDGVAEYSAPSQGYLGGQTHTQSKSCSTSTCSAGAWDVTVNARTVGTTPWWADTQVKTIVVN